MPMPLRQILVPLLAILAVAIGAVVRGADDPTPVVPDYPAATQKAANPGLPTIFVVGDSTARSDAPLRGWGSELEVFFDTTKINVVNRAIGGRSSRTFITEGRWDKVLAELKAGDFVLVQFGHNDNGDYKDPAAKGRPSIRSDGEETAQAINADLKTMETIHSFGWYMRKYATDAKAKGATPILLSMVPHKIWASDKVSISRPERDTFIKWTRADAKATAALFIDANEIIAEGLERLGPAKVDPLFGDARTHSSPEGAKYNAAAVVVGIKALNPDPLAKYFSKQADNLPATLKAIVAATAPAAN
jgi:lysophospholipase L1-like esterase